MTETRTHTPEGYKLRLDGKIDRRSFRVKKSCASCGKLFQPCRKRRMLCGYCFKNDGPPSKVFEKN